MFSGRSRVGDTKRVDEVTEQKLKELEYLKHAIRNGTTKIEGCLRQVEEITKAIDTAVQAYLEGIEDEDDPYP